MTKLNVDFSSPEEDPKTLDRGGLFLGKKSQIKWRKLFPPLNVFTKYCLIMAVSIVFSFSLNAQVFIKQNPTGSGNGSSWSNAAGAFDLESAIDQGGTIYVAAGNYTFSQTVRLEENVSITGGYPTNASGNDLSGYDPATNVTILDGTSSSLNKSAFEIIGDFDAAQVTIRGIQFQNWRGSDGAVFGALGRVINPVNYTFDECSFINNQGNVGVINLSNLKQGQNQIYFSSKCW